jgi:hypothetical protein
MASLGNESKDVIAAPGDSRVCNLSTRILKSCSTLLGVPTLAFLLAWPAAALFGQPAGPEGVPLDGALVDGDRDGLPDVWELDGFEHAGAFEPLAAYGCDPTQMDVLVEVDWMETAGGDPTPGALAAYQAAVDLHRFFLDRTNGRIRIHVDVGANILAQAGLEAPEEGAPDFSVFANEPDPAKVVPFQDTLTVRPLCQDSSARLSLYGVYEDGRYFRPSRRNVFYYLLLANQGPPTDSRPLAGITTNFADEESRRMGLTPTGVQVGAVFLDALRDPDPQLQRMRRFAAVLHELGHGFGLGHGGTLPGGRWDNTVNKPNYPSVMNLRYQFWGVDVRDGEPLLDFSHGRFSAISERALDERAGFGMLPNPHLLANIGVAHLESFAHEFPANLDWNENGVVDVRPFVQDVNFDGIPDELSFADHDDWGKFRRDGFDGIGLNAFRGCGLGCVAANDVVRLWGDFNGDGTRDLLLLHGRRAALVLHRAEILQGAAGTLADSIYAVYEERIGPWQFSVSDQALIADFDKDGRDDLFLHRESEAAVLRLGDGAVQALWLGSGVSGGSEDPPPEAGEEPEGGEPIEPKYWPLDRDDRFQLQRLRPDARWGLLVHNAERAAVFEWRDGTLRLAWEASRPLSSWTQGERPGLFTGRVQRDRGGTFYLKARGVLVEFDARLPEVPAVRWDEDGSIPTLDETREPWAVSPLDCLFPADLDGDGRDELIVKTPRRIGVVRETEAGNYLVWSSQDRIGVWPMSADDFVVRGSFLLAPGAPAPQETADDVVISNGRSWLGLAWNRSEQMLEPMALADGFINDPSGGVPWALSPSQRIFTARLLAAEPLLLVAQDADRLLLARMERAGPQGSGFHQVAAFYGTVAGWSLSGDDSFVAGNADDDPEHELFVRKRDILGVLDFSPAARLAFLARYDATRAELISVPLFRRGDSNGDGSVDLTDPIVVLLYLFHGHGFPACESASDADDNGELELTDAIRVLNFLFSGGPPPAPPGPYEPGIDPSPDELNCRGVR